MNNGLLCITCADMMHRMTTKNPRLTITLQPTLAAQLRRLSELTGDSQSAIIAELLEGSAPVFDRLIVVLTAAQDAKESMKGRLAADMEQAQGKVEAQLGLALEHFDAFTKPLLDEAEAVKRRARRRPRATRQGVTGRAPGAAPGVVPTPLSNRGVRYGQTATENIAKNQEPVKVKRRKVAEKNTGVEK